MDLTTTIKNSLSNFRDNLDSDKRLLNNMKRADFIKRVTEMSFPKAPSRILFKLLQIIKGSPQFLKEFGNTILPHDEERFEVLWRQNYDELTKTLVNNRDLLLRSYWDEWTNYLVADCRSRCATKKYQIIYYDILLKLIKEEKELIEKEKAAGLYREEEGLGGGGENKENNSATDKVIRRLSMKYNKKYNKKYKSALFATGDDNVCGKKKQNLKKKKEIEKKKKKKELEKKKKEIEKKKKKKELEKKKKKKNKIKKTKI